MEVNKIYLGDCYELIKQVADKSIDLIVTDPPYGINYHSNMRTDKSHPFCSPIANDENLDIVKSIIPELFRVLKDDSAIYMFCSPDKVDSIKSEMDKYFKVKNIIIWVKGGGWIGDLEAQYGKQYEMVIYANKGRKKLNGKRIGDVWQSGEIMGLKRVVGIEQTHQNEKPLELIKLMIEKSSNKNDLVIDPFLGSGTTAVACKELGRNYIGFEIDKDYFKIAVDRLNGIKPNGQTSIFTDFEQLNLLED